MSRFLIRSDKQELIDQPDIPFSDWEKCLHELNTVNTLLGGHAITVNGVKELLPSENSFSIAEIGCGGGDNLKAIHQWNRNKLHIQYTGIDLNKACIDFAEKNCNKLPDKKFIHSDYRNVQFTHLPDIIFSSLFCHHFTNKQLVEMLLWLKKNCTKGFFINDLHRHPLAYYSIKWITRIFSGSYLIKNDAPVSVLRGFRRKEWESLLKQAGINSFKVRWKWAFRYLIIVHND